MLGVGVAVGKVIGEHRLGEVERRVAGRGRPDEPRPRGVGPAMEVNLTDGAHRAGRRAGGVRRLGGSGQTPQTGPPKNQHQSNHDFKTNRMYCFSP